MATRINCHSALQHYDMFHNKMGCGDGNFGSIFNTTYNINTGGGSGFWGGFRTCLGQGLGATVAGIFGGFLGSLCGGFCTPWGGFPTLSFPSFSGFFGYGLDIGGGFPWISTPNSNYFGNGNSSCSCSCCSGSGSGSTAPATIKTENDEEKRVKEAGDSEISVKDSSSSNGTKKVKINNLSKTEIEALNSDDIKSLSTEQQKALLKRYNEVGANNEDLKTALEAAVDSSGGADGQGGPDKVNLDNITAEGIAKLDNPTLTAMSETDISKLLTKLSVTKKNSQENTLSLPATMSAVNLQALKKIADAKGLLVAVANNTDSNDQWIAGKIDNITESDGKLSYTIDCSSNKNATYKFKYKVTLKDNNKYTIAYESGTPAAGQTLYHKAQEYEFKDGVLERKGTPVISRRTGDGYTKI